MKLHFVVAGRPNKGKSSVVATLTRDETIAISARSGTTTHSQQYEISLGDSSLVLTDTPGLQRPSKVLAWLENCAKETGSGADQREHIVRGFIADPHARAKFPDEADVLSAIMNSGTHGRGAAIVYVVDGSVPYDRSYEPEMAVLQWTGQLSMAIVNPVHGDAYIDQWRSALNHYFKLVRIFNAHFDSSESQLQLLEDFSHIEPAWKEPLTRIVLAMREQRLERSRRSAELAADLLDQLCRFQLKQRVSDQAAAKLLREHLQTQFFDTVRETETAAFDALQKIYRHQGVERQDSALIIEQDLFDTRQWALWGLSRGGLTMTGAASGALLGVGADALSAGLTLGVGLSVGALIGAGGAWLSADKLVGLKVRGLSAGGYEAVQGPVSSPNFPYVLLGRFLLVHRALHERNHARRDAMRVADSHFSPAPRQSIESKTENDNQGADAKIIGSQRLEDALKALSESQRGDIHAALHRLSRQKNVEDLYGILLPLFI